MSLWGTLSIRAAQIQDLPWGATMSFWRLVWALVCLSLLVSPCMAQQCVFSPVLDEVKWVEQEPGLVYGTWSAKAKKKTKTEAAVPAVFVHILRVDLSQGGLTIRSLKPLGRSMTLENIVEYFRKGGVDVRAALNGDYYSFAETEKNPNGLHVSGGQVLFFPANTTSLMITADNVAHVGKVPLVASIEGGGVSLGIDSANRAPGSDQAALYSGFYDEVVSAQRGCRRVVMTRTALEVMANSQISVKVSDVKTAGGQVKMQPMDLVLVACGKKSEAIKAWKAGDALVVKTRIEGVQGPVMEAISGGPRVLRGGAVTNEISDEGFSFAMKAYLPTRHPRSALGVSADGKVVWLLAGEGRNKRSAGLTAFDTGCILKALGAADALLVDGGGSSALFVEGKFMNQPHQTTKRTKRDLANCLGVVRLPPKK